MFSRNKLETLADDLPGRWSILQRGPENIVKSPFYLLDQPAGQGWLANAPYAQHSNNPAAIFDDPLLQLGSLLIASIKGLDGWRLNQALLLATMPNGLAAR